MTNGRDGMAGGGIGAIRPVLLIHPSNDIYGSDRSARRTVEALAVAGPVTLLVPDAGPLDDLDGPAVQVRRSDFAILRKADAGSALSQALLFLRVCTVGTVRAIALLRRIRPRLVYVNTVVCPQWIIAARLLRIPVVTHVREIERGLPTLVQRALLLAPACSRTVVTNSMATREWLLDEAPRSATRALTIVNGIDRPMPAVPAPARDRIVVVGRLSERKGQHVALEAFAVVARQRPDARLTLVGAEFGPERHYETALRTRAAELELEDRVEFVGEVSDQWPCYDAADVVLVPSLQEPFGNVAVEAGLSGRPVIASAVEGLTEIVVDGATGLLVPAGDAQALALATLRLLDDPEWADRLAAAASDRCRRDFSVAAYGRAVREVVGAGDPGAAA